MTPLAIVCLALALTAILTSLFFARKTLTLLDRSENRNQTLTMFLLTHSAKEPSRQAALAIEAFQHIKSESTLEVIKAQTLEKQLRDLTTTPVPKNTKPKDSDSVMKELLLNGYAVDEEGNELELL